MNQNNYNVCGRCGSANPLSARYCYQCGFELKSPEAPVVCTKCNTVNPGQFLQTLRQQTAQSAVKGYLSAVQCRQ